MQESNSVIDVLLKAPLPTNWSNAGEDAKRSSKMWLNGEEANYGYNASRTGEIRPTWNGAIGSFFDPTESTR